MEQARELAEYYSRRAPEYDRIYEKPERQGDLAVVRECVRERFRDEDVLEIACGTGFWTEVLAEVARSVIAVDINESVLRIARGRGGAERVRFERADVYALPELPRASACLAGFWWSHMPKGRIAAFLSGMHKRLQPGSTVMFMDNCYVEGNSTRVSRVDAEGNSYQMRMLEDGSTHEVLKNFATDSELERAVRPFANRMGIRRLTYYWILTYEIEGQGRARS